MNRRSAQFNTNWATMKITKTMPSSRGMGALVFNSSTGRVKDRRSSATSRIAAPGDSSMGVSAAPNQ